MPYIDEQKKQDDVQAQDVGQQGVVSTSSAPGAGPGSSTGKASAPQATPAQPFQNLSAYLSANAPQIQQQANTISGGLNNQYGQVQSDINKGVSDFGNQVQAGYAQPNQDLVNKAATNPTEFVKDPNNVKGFQSLYNDVYSGPSNFESSGAYGDLSSSVNKAMSDAALFGSNSGVQTYLQGQNPNATKGGNILDSVLLQGSTDAYGQVKNAAKQFNTLPDYLTQSTTGANAVVPIAQQTAKDTSANLQKQFTGEGGIVSQFQNDIDARVAQARAEAAAKSNTAHDVLEAGNVGGMNAADVSDQMLSELGISRDQYTNLLNQRDTVNKTAGYSPVDLASYLGLTSQAPDVAIQRNNVASDEDYAKADALSKLTGQDVSSFLGPKGGTAGNLNSINPQQIAALDSLFKDATAPKPVDRNPTDSNLSDVITGPIGGGNTGDVGDLIDKISKPADSISKPFENVGETLGDTVSYIGDRTGIDPGTIPNIIANPLITPTIDFGNKVGDVLGDAADSISKSIFGGGTNLTDAQRQTNEINDVNKYIAGLSPEDLAAYKAAHPGDAIKDGKVIGVTGKNKFGVF